MRTSKTPNQNSNLTQSIPNPIYCIRLPIKSNPNTIQYIPFQIIAIQWMPNSSQSPHISVTELQQPALESSETFPQRYSESFPRSHSRDAAGHPGELWKFPRSHSKGQQAAPGSSEAFPRSRSRGAASRLGMPSEGHRGAPNHFRGLAVEVQQATI